MKANRSLLKTAVVNLALLAVSLLLVLIVLEAGLRTWFWMRARTAPTNTQIRTWVAPDEDLGYRLHPEFRHFSADGSQAAVAGQKTGKFRVLILGDSVAFNGNGFSDTLVGKTEEILNRDAKLAPTQFLNSSVPGYTNYQELLYLKKYGLSFQPRLVGVIFVMNDVHRLLHTFQARRGEPFAAGEMVFTEEARNALDSPLHRWIQRSVLLRIVRYEVKIASDLVALYESDGFSFDFRGDLHSAWQDEPWNMIDEQMREMTELGARHGFRVFLVAVPFGDQLRPGYLARDPAYVKKPQRKLESICRALDIPYLDLFNDLDLEKHFHGDRLHLSREGRAVVASRIAAFLQAEQLIPAE